MAKLTVQLVTLRKPEWPSPLKPGTEVTLKTEAPKIKAGQHIEFRVLCGTDLVDVVNGQDAQQTAKWTVPNLPHSPKLKFDAILHEKPSAKTGVHAVLGKITSPEAEVKGFAVTITSIDAAFVPHAESIQVAYSVSDPATVATKGRAEVWGERYPTDKPLYTGTLTATQGAHTWTWDGKATAGPLSGKYISPEFSPYRVRFITGTDQGSVDDAFGAGLKKVAVAEKPFEVEFQSVNIRIQAGITEAAAAGSGHRLNQALAVEPQPLNPNGTFAAMGRLPLEQETAPGPARAGVGRIRIPMARHDLVAEDPSQGGLAIGAAYTTGVAPKNTIDAGYYTRPELPIEFEIRLKSRVDATNLSPTFGIWDKEAVGPVKIEPFAEDVFLTALYGGAGVNQTYWRKSVCKVKHGTHQAPVNSGGNPIFHHWQARFPVPGGAAIADGNQTFDLDTFDVNDQTYRYVLGSGELKVYLNRTLLTLGADEATINKGHADYIEVDVHTIKLRPKLYKADDVLWIVRSAAAGGVANWNAYPPGANCHIFYGGVRGAAPNNLFLNNHSGAPGAPHEPIIGLATGAYPYHPHSFINLAPDSVPAAQQERVEAMAILTGAQQGLAGIIFSPSYIAGDTYVLHGRLNRVPYERNLGWEDEKAYIDGKSGQMSVWRVMSVSNSQRLPDPTTNGLAAGVGCPVEAPVAGRPHIGDGVNMSISGTNTMLANAFNEWTTPPPNAGIAPAADVHKDVNLTTYRNANNGAGIGATLGAGQVNMPNNGAVLNIFSPVDHYRIQLPGDLPANRVNVAANTIAGLAPGTTSAAAMAAVSAAIGALAGAAPDAALGGGVAPIPLHASSGQAYKTWVDGLMSAHRDAMITALTPSLAPQPKTMQVIRWTILEDNPIWVSGAGAMASNGQHTVGYDRGDGQSIFETTAVSASLFPHEMGHSMHLVHFVAGNFGWKHHNFVQPDCMMSYNFPTGIVVQPGGAVGPAGGGAAVDTGWPHVVPLPLPRNTQITPPGGPAGAPCIILDAKPPHPAPGNPCAKCVLKLRGWLETVLPVAWRHPDLF
jgi:hypothetical protein